MYIYIYIHIYIYIYPHSCFRCLQLGRSVWVSSGGLFWQRRAQHIDNDCQWGWDTIEGGPPRMARTMQQSLSSRSWRRGRRPTAENGHDVICGVVGHRLGGHGRRRRRASLLQRLCCRGCVLRHRAGEGGQDGLEDQTLRGGLRDRSLHHEHLLGAADVRLNTDDAELASRH